MRAFVISAVPLALTSAGIVANRHHQKMHEIRIKDEADYAKLQPAIDRILSVAERYGIEVSQRSEGTRLLLCIELPQKNNEFATQSSVSSYAGARMHEEQEHDLLWLKEHFGAEAQLMFPRIFADISQNYPGGWIDAETEIDNIEWETKHLQRDGRIPDVEVEGEDERRYEEFRQTILQSDASPGVVSSEGRMLGNAIVTYEGEGIECGGHTDSFATHVVKKNMNAEIGEPTFAVVQMRLPTHETILAHEESVRQAEIARLAEEERKRQQKIDDTMRTVFSLVRNMIGPRQR